MLAGAATVLLTVELGHWQLRRAAEKTTLQQAIDERSTQAPTALGADTPPAWTPVRLDGQWHPRHLFYVDNRIHQGRAGYHVFAPFLDRASGHWVMVARGWIAAGSDRSQLPAVTTTAGPTTLTGHVRLPGESFTLTDATADGARWQAVDLDAWRRATGLLLAPFYLQQTSAAPDGLAREWPRPDAGIDRHRAYAMQWFAMAMLATGLTILYLWRLFRRTRRVNDRAR